MDATKTLDDLEAVRTIAAALSTFKQPDQERIIRWVREKVGLSTEVKTADVSVTHHDKAGHLQESTTAPSQHNLPIKQFALNKNPKSDNQFAAVVAYYHRFEAQGAERKDTITANDLIEACRKVNWKRLKRPSQTLINAYQGGLLDKGGERGEFTINSVGENLVAMALPESSGVNNKAIHRAQKSARKRAKPKTTKSKK